MKCFTIIMVLFLFLSGSVIAQEKISVETMPPVVVKTSPAAGETAVDPNIKEIKVTFSKEMSSGYSWVETGYGDYPKTTGDAVFLEDKKTCVAPVELEAGKTYVLWLNSEKYKNFKDSEGRPAIPYLLVFETKSE